MRGKEIIIKMLMLIFFLNFAAECAVLPAAIANKKLSKLTLKIPPMCGKGFNFND